MRWRGNGAERWRTTVFDGTERSPENRDNGPLNWSFEIILAITSTDGIRTGSVRDAEVPGSNPGSPTTKVPGESVATDDLAQWSTENWRDGRP